MSSYDDLIKKKGYPVVEEGEELKKFLDKLSSGPGKKLLSDSDSPSDTAMGNDDVKNIFYVNFDPNSNMLTDDQREQLKTMQADIDLNCNFLSVKAGQTVQDKIDSAELSDDSDMDAKVKRSTYRAKIVDYLLQHSAWMGTFATQSLERTFSVDKSEFHATLLTAIFEGVTMPASVFGKLEPLLNEISSSIVDSRSSGSKKMFWILMTVYTWEQTMQVFRPSVRTIYFEATDEVTTHTTNKSEVTTVNMTLGWMQQDCIFNSESFPRETILQMLKDAGVDIVNDPIEIPVD